VLAQILADEDYCYVTTTGRVTGKPHTIEIWFAADGDTLYLLAGGRERSDWVRNIRSNGAVSVRIRDATWRAMAHVVADAHADARARALLLEKYAPRYSGDLESWGRTALPVAITLKREPENA
jgi:deazaflavin-dependent oxidoreductase (nitroreductase family)